MAVVGSAIDALIGSQVASQFGNTISAAISLIGYWLVTAPDPEVARRTSPWNLRTMTRVLAVAGCVGTVFDYLMTGSSISINRPLTITFAVLYGVFTLGGVIGTFFMFLLMRRIALRIPDDHLARSTRIVMIGLVSCLGLILLAGLLVALVVAASQGNPAGSWGAGLGILMLSAGCFTVLGFFVFGIWWIVLLFRYRMALNAATASALQTWMRQATHTETPSGPIET